MAMSVSIIYYLLINSNFKLEFWTRAEDESNDKDTFILQCSFSVNAA